VVDSKTFRQISGFWATGVSVLTTVNKAGRYYGLTMNALTSLSLAPPLLLVCIDNKSETIKPLAESRVFAVSILKHEQKPIAQAFAKKGAEKFERTATVKGRSGAPLISGALATIECQVAKCIEGGDHTVIFGQIDHFEMGEGAPLIFYRGGYGRLRSPE
jgi:flavin reductase (DIM6/NTAB) family NADH-FMN oxidoreductase RutF